MSELQNKIVRLLQARHGTKALADAKGRRRNFILQALAVYHSMGGSDDELEALKSSTNLAASTISEATGKLVFELAALAHLADFDIIQAAYNLIDADNVQQHR